MLLQPLFALTLPLIAISWSIRHPFHKTPIYNSIDHQPYDDTHRHSFKPTHTHLDPPAVFQLNILTPDGPAGIRLVRDGSFPGPDYPYPVLAPPDVPDSPRLVFLDGKIWIEDSGLVFGRFQLEDRSYNPKRLMFGDSSRMIPLEFKYQEGDSGGAFKPRENYASAAGIIVLDGRLCVQLFDGAPPVKLVVAESSSEYGDYEKEYLDLKE